jgi:hypothetical protein
MLASMSMAAQRNSEIDEEGKVIVDALSLQKIPPPELGWVMPSGELVTEVASKEVTILSEKIEPSVAVQIGIISAKSVQAFVKKNQVDCDQMDGDTPVTLYRYATHLPASKFTIQVLVITGRFSTNIQAGFKEYQATDIEAKPVWQAMNYGAGQRQRIRSVQQSDGKVFYTFAATYSKDGKLFRKGVFLEDHSGKLLGKHIDNVGGQEECDGCAVITYRDGIERVYAFQNLLSVPEIHYPMLLEDSSTVEGRSIDLFTFSASGQASQYRKYEYMVTCILGPDPNVTTPKLN